MAALLADKANADERLAGHEQIIEDLQQRLQAESGVIRAAGAKEKETRATLEREREAAANAERTLRRRVVELEQAAVETQVWRLFPSFAFVVLIGDLQSLENTCRFLVSEMKCRLNDGKGLNDFKKNMSHYFSIISLL